MTDSLMKTLSYLVVGLMVLSCSACAVKTLPTVVMEEAAVTQAAPTEAPLEPLPSLLTNMEIPREVQPYPADFPAELHLPDGFQPVGFNYAGLPGADKPNWTVIIRRAGDMHSAVTGMSSFLNGAGWQVVDETILDYEGRVWIIQNGAGNTGLVSFGLQATGEVVILTTFNI